MPAESKAQQTAAGMALAAKKGKIPVSKLKGASLTMYNNMSMESLSHFAETKRRGLPKKKTKDREYYDR